MSSELPLGRFRIGLAALVIPPLLRVVSLPTLTRWIEPKRSRSSDQPLDEGRLAERVDGLLGRLPGPWKRTCLSRAAVLYYLLRRAGRPVELRIGVRREAGQLLAHAWLVRDGVPFLEPGAEHVGRYVEVRG